MASPMDAVCLQGCYGKIKLLDFSVKFLLILSEIDIHNSSVTHPYHKTVGCFSVKFLPILSEIDICNSSVTYPYHKTLGCPCGIPNVLDSSTPINFFADMHGHAGMCPRTIWTGFTDDKDASRTVRTGFTDRFVVSTLFGKLRKDSFSWTRAYIRPLGFSWAHIHFAFWWG